MNFNGGYLFFLDNRNRIVRRFTLTRGTAAGAETDLLAYRINIASLAPDANFDILLPALAAARLYRAVFFFTT